MSVTNHWRRDVLGFWGWNGHVIKDTLGGSLFKVGKVNLSCPFLLKKIIFSILRWSIIVIVFHIFVVNGGESPWRGALLVRHTSSFLGDVSVRRCLC